MASLLAWIVFGLLAAVQIGGLPSEEDRTGSISLILLCSVVCVASLIARIVGAVRLPDAQRLGMPLALCLLILVGCAVWLHQPEGNPRWTAAALAALGYFSVSLLALLGGIAAALVVAARREASVRHERALSAAQQRLDRLGQPIGAPASGAGVALSPDAGPVSGPAS